MDVKEKKALADALTNANGAEKKKRKPRKSSVPIGIPEIVELSKGMPLDIASKLVKQLKADVDRRIVEIKELVKIAEEA